MPPSLPTKLTCGSRGSSTIACWSAWTVAPPTGTNVAPVSVERNNDTPPNQIRLALVGSMATVRSYQHCVKHDAPLATSFVHDAPPSVLRQMPSSPPSLPPTPNASCTAATIVPDEPPCASAIRPTSEVGRPAPSRAHVAPRSMDLYTPLRLSALGNPIAA